MRVFIAGAAGAIGRRLVPLLMSNGHHVVAMTRSSDKAALLRSMGATPVVVDGLNAQAVGEAVARAEPEVVIHQMTSLTGTKNLRRFNREFAMTNELRTRGTDHLLAAGIAAGVRRFIAQSFTGWTNARTGGPVKTEEDALDPAPLAAQSATLEAIRYLERTVVGAHPVEGIVLRYGLFYGPGASNGFRDLLLKRRFPVLGNGAGIWSFIHVEDAATATIAALTRGTAGVYNIVDDDPAPVAVWLPYLASAVGAKTPMHLPTWLGRIAAGRVVVRMMTEIRGSSNAKARRELDWKPRWSSWRDGFRFGLAEGEPT